MCQQVKALAVKPDYLSSVSQDKTVKRENALFTIYPLTFIYALWLVISFPSKQTMIK